MGETAILKIEDLRISFIQYTKGLQQITLPVIRSLDVTVSAGEMVAVIGASGSGKSLLAHAIMGILPNNALAAGRIEYCGTELTPKRVEVLRGKEVVLVPQSLSFLDPLMKIGEQVRKGRSDEKTKRKQRQIFERYHLPMQVGEQYPFELSGGMNRRVLVSTALIEEPKLVIADEPTPGMDLELAKRAVGHLRELADAGAGVLVITHDLELAAATADRIIVFYAGQTIEEAEARDFEQEQYLRHPYTKALWRALPQNGFEEVKGGQPNAKGMPKGCAYAARCHLCEEKCLDDVSYRQVRGGRVRCWLAN